MSSVCAIRARTPRALRPDEISLSQNRSLVPHDRSVTERGNACDGSGPGASARGFKPRRSHGARRRATDPASTYAYLRSRTPKFESNFPVDRRGTNYVVLWNAFKKTAAGYSDAEKAELFRGAAHRAYRIGA